MNEKTVSIIAALLPTAVSLTTQVLEFAKAANEEGYEIPAIDELIALNRALKDLPDLE
jgi:hypothetical protein